MKRMKKFGILVGCVVGVLILGSGVYVAMKFFSKRVPKATSITYSFKMTDFVNKMLETIHAKAAYAEEKDPAYELLLQGVEYCRQKNFDKAIEYFQKVADDYPDSQYAPLALGYIAIAWSYKYMFEGETKKEYLLNAIAAEKRLINTYPETEEAVIAYGAIGTTYGELGDWQNAVIYLEKALEKCKEKNFSREHIALAMGGLAGAYCMIEKFEEALPLFQKLLTEYSDTNKVKETGGVLYQALGGVYASLEENYDYDKAIKYYKLALEKNAGIKDLGIPTFLIAETYHYGKEDKENAKIWYQKVVDEYPESECYEEAKKRLEELKK